MTHRLLHAALFGGMIAVALTARSWYWVAIWLLAAAVCLIAWGAWRCTRPKHPPGLDVDGEPLTDEEWLALAGIHLVTDIVDVPEPVYPRQDGAR